LVFAFIFVLLFSKQSQEYFQTHIAMVPFIFTPHN